MSSISENELNLILLVLLASGLLIVYSTRVQKALNWWTLQTVFISILILIQGISNNELEVVIIGSLMFFVKGVIIPWLLRRVLKESNTEWVGELFLKRTSSLVVAVGLTLMAYVVTKPLVALPEPGFRNGLAIALALLFYGLLLLMVRKVALIQVIGILLVDNGIFLAGFFLTKGMPLLVEMGIIFDILIGVIILMILSKRMLKDYDSLNVDHMKKLKG